MLNYFVNSEILTTFAYPNKLKVNKMLQKEFEDRTGVKVSFEEYSAIETVYLESCLDKDEFCKIWCKMNASRVKKAQEDAKTKEQERKTKDTLLSIINKINIETEKRGFDCCNLPYTWEFLSKKDLKVLEKSGIEIEMTYKKAIEFGYSGPRFYRIDDTRYHIKKYLKIA